MSDDLIRRSDAIKKIAKKLEWELEVDMDDKVAEWLNAIPAVEPNLILPERMERGECYEVGETIVVMNHDDYYDLLCKSMENEPKQGEWIKAKPKGVISYSEAYAECDQCHEAVFIGWSMNFCPHCGARMKGTDDGEMA